MSDLKPCPFCGGAVSECDESPLYGGSIMHDETECLFKNNLLFHGNIAERCNSRPLEDALRSRIAKLEAKLESLQPQSPFTSDGTQMPKYKILVSEVLIDGCSYGYSREYSGNTLKECLEKSSKDISGMAEIEIISEPAPPEDVKK